MISIKTILLPIDFSDIANQSQYVAEVFAQQHGATLVLLHVVRSPQPDLTSPQMIREHAEQIDSARRCLIASTPLFAETNTEYRVVSGDPGKQIVDMARQVHADVIVLGTHGQAEDKGRVLGTVAEYVIRNAPCSVLTVKPGPGWELSRLLRQPGSAPSACSFSPIDRGR